MENIVRDNTFVAPYMGAWIEILFLLLDFAAVIVAPYMGAWIEIMPPDYYVS